MLLFSSTDCHQSLLTEKRLSLALLTAQITDNESERAKLRPILENNNNALIKATEHLTKARTEANDAIKMLRLSSVPNSKDTVLPDLIADIDIELIMTQKEIAAKGLLANKELPEFENLLTILEHKLKTTEASAAQEQPTAEDTAAAAEAVS
jgi:hypothetical protein